MSGFDGFAETTGPRICPPPRHLTIEGGAEAANWRMEVLPERRGAGASVIRGLPAGLPLGAE